MNFKIAVIIPAFNEAKTIGKVIEDFSTYLPESLICVVNNNSTDDTYQIAKNKFISLQLDETKAIVLNEYKKGKAFAVKKAFYTVNAEVYVMIDADCTYDVAQIKELLLPVQNGKVDMVVADRHSLGHYKKENKRVLNGVGNNLVKFLINLLYQTNLKDILSGYRVFNKAFVKNFPITTSGFELETELTLFALEHNFSIQEIPTLYSDRPADNPSKLNTLVDGYKVLLKLFTIFKNYKPLIFFGFLSIFFAILSLVIGVPVFLEYLDTKYVGRFPSAFLAMGCAILCIIFLTVALILDTIVNIDKKNIEYRLMDFYSKINAN